MFKLFDTGPAPRPAQAPAAAPVAAAAAAAAAARQPPPPRTAPGRGGGAAGLAPADAAPAPASTAAAKKRPAPLRPVDSIAWPRALDSAIGAEAQPAAAGVVGSEDRLWHLALVAAPGRPLLRAPAPAKKQAGSVARPKSRGECERRCGGVGRCDAGHADGCGGALCAADATNATDDAEVV